jgi:hypothetical protein
MRIAVSGRLAFFAAGLLISSVVSGCSSAGPGLPNHPLDCSLGISWADCLPGTAGYRGPNAADLATAARAKSVAATRECQESRLRGEIKTHKESVECSNPKIFAAWQQAQYPYMDLVQLQLSARLVGAENLDKKKITEAEFQLQLAELQTRIAAEEQRRRVEVSNAQANQAQANAALLRGLGAFQVGQAASGAR